MPRFSSVDRLGGTVMAFTTALTGCASRTGPPGGATVRDSAGIQIVDNTAPSWRGPGWTVSDTPSVSIGGGAAGSQYEFSRVVGAVRLRNGNLAVANVGTGEIRLFDSAGRFLKGGGRLGSGPGEFQVLGGLWRGVGDSLLAADIRAQRLAVFDSAGGFVRHFALGGRSGIAVQAEGRINLAIPQAWLADGSVVGLEMPFSISQQREGRYRDTVTYLRFGPDGAARDTIGRFPGIEMDQMTLSFGGRTFPTPSPVPLGRTTVVTARGTHVFVTTNGAWEVEERGTSGSRVRLIRLAVPPIVVTPEDVETHRREQVQLLDGLPEMRAVPPELKTQMTDRVRSAKYPPTLPFIAGIQAGSDGTLWVQEMGRPGEQRQQFAVFDSTGVFLGRVRAPPRFQPTTIGTNEMVGVWKDSDDVEHVRVYPIRRP